MYFFVSGINIDSNELLLLIGIAISVLILLIVVLSFIIQHRDVNQFRKNVKESSNSLRVFVIDSHKDKVYFFNRARLRERRITSITEFYNQFPANERSKIISWIGRLLEGAPDTPMYLEINVLINYNKKSFFSLLKVEKVDRAKGLIFLESYLLKYMYAQKSKNAQIKKFLSREKYEDILFSSRNKYKGITIAINFFNKRTLNPTISHLVFAQIKNVLVPYISPTRPMLEYLDDKIVISDLKISTRAGTIALINTFKNEINRLLMITSNEERVGYTFGAAENKNFSSFDELIQTVTLLSDVAKDDKKDVIFHDIGHKVSSDGSVQHYRTEVERIVQDKKLKYEYRPIYNVTRNRLLGYQAFISPLDSFFDSIDELKTYALRTEDDKELFATIARNSISRFIQEKDGVTLRLFFPLSINEIPYVNRTFAHISSIKDTNIVLILSEDDLLSMPKDSNDSLIAMLKTFKSKGYEVSLLINNKETALPPQIYEAFDYFLISVTSHLTGRRVQGRQLPTFQSLIEQLLRYNKPIVATDIPTWELVEYIIKLGIEIVSSEAISQRSENVLPLSKKALTKLKNMN